MNRRDVATSQSPLADSGSRGGHGGAEGDDDFKSVKNV